LTLQREADRQSDLAQAVLTGTLFDRPDQGSTDPLAPMAGKHSQAIQIKMIRADLVKDAPNDYLTHGEVLTKHPDLSLTHSFQKAANLARYFRRVPQHQEMPGAAISLNRAFGAFCVINSAVDRDITTLCSARRISIGHEIFSTASHV